MGKSSSQTIGFWYQVLYHAGLGVGPFDAFLEFRGGDKTAWQGELTSSGTISINAPYLWGGEKDQGGIVGDVDVMFGEATQMPNPYLLANLGPQVPAWRGMATLVFKGGKYGAMNPYPQKASYKIRKIKNGWDTDPCWFPEKAEVPLIGGYVAMLGTGWEYKVETFTEPNTAWNDFTVPASGWQPGGEMPFVTNGMSGGPYWTPTRSNIWLRRRMQIHATGLTLNIGADNGCVVWVDGVNVGSSNPTNEPIANNQNNPVSFTFVATGEVEVVVKAFAEINAANDIGNVVDVSFSGETLLGMNPAHVLYYARTHSAIGREPIANINDASYRAAADRLYAEGFGICTEYDPQAESLEEFEQRICKLIGGSVSRSLVDGQWYLDLARGDYVLEDLPILTDDDILDFSEQPSTLDGAINSVSVKYFDPQRKEAIVTPPVQALALVDAFGTIHQTNEYPEIPIAALAARVADRDLRATVTPTRAFELATTRKPYAWRPNQYFRLQSPKRGIADMVCIVGEKQSGTLRSGAIKLKSTQDIYALPSTTFVEVEPGVDTRPSETPVPIALQRTFEAPYIDVSAVLPRAEMQALPADVGYLVAVAADPASSRDFTLSVAVDGGTDFTATANGEWTPTALVVEAAGPVDTSFTLTGSFRLDRVAVGAPVYWDDEIGRVDAIDAVAGTIEIARGCADAVPAPSHAAGSRLWFWSEGAAADTTEYTDGESIDIKLLTNTGSRQLAPESASLLEMTFDQRVARPYAPGRLQINAIAYPSYLFGPLTVTWAHRDRVLQADQLVDTLATSIGPEAGTTYTAYWYLDNVLVHTEVGISGTTASYSPASDGVVRVEIEAIRSGLASWQRLQHEFPYTVTEVHMRVTPAGDVRVTPAGDIRVVS